MSNKNNYAKQRNMKQTLSFPVPTKTITLYHLNQYYNKHTSWTDVVGHKEIAHRFIFSFPNIFQVKFQIMSSFVITMLNLILQQHVMSLVRHGRNGMMGNAAISVAMEREFKVETGLALIKTVKLKRKLHSVVT